MSLSVQATAPAAPMPPTLRERVINCTARMLKLRPEDITADTRLTDQPLQELEREVPEVGYLRYDEWGLTVGQILQVNGAKF